jgi:hypothetical protein
MSDQEELREDAPEPEDERWDMEHPPREAAPNPTQEAIDEEGPSDEPVDAGGWTQPAGSPHEGETGQADDVA